MLVAQNIELFTLALSGIAIILILRSKIPDSQAKYRTPGNPKYEIYKSPPLLDDLDPPLVCSCSKAKQEWVSQWTFLAEQMIRTQIESKCDPEKRV